MAGYGAMPSSSRLQSQPMGHGEAGAKETGTGQLVRFGDQVRRWPIFRHRFGVLIRHSSLQPSAGAVHFPTSTRFPPQVSLFSDEKSGFLTTDGFADVRRLGIPCRMGYHAVPTPGHAPRCVRADRLLRSAAAGGSACGFWPVCLQAHAQAIMHRQEEAPQASAAGGAPRLWLHEYDNMVNNAAARNQNISQSNVARATSLGVTVWRGNFEVP